MPSNILAARLKELQAAGVIRRAPRSRVIVYELTPYGRELELVVLALGAWDFRAMGEPREDQIITADSLTMDLRSAFRPLVAVTLPTTAYAARVGGVELLIRIDGPTLARDTCPSRGGPWRRRLIPCGPSTFPLPHMLLRAMCTMDGATKLRVRSNRMPNASPMSDCCTMVVAMAGSSPA